jgi:hypothetical protein
VVDNVAHQRVAATGDASFVTITNREKANIDGLVAPFYIDDAETPHAEGNVPASKKPRSSGPRCMMSQAM